MHELDHYRNLQRPVADVKIGDEVVIIDPEPHRNDTWRGIVEKVARVWITVQAPGLRECRFRRDTQSENTGAGWGGYRFATPEQHDFDQRIARAKRVLADRKIEAAWSNVPAGHLIAMAEMLAEFDTPTID